MFKYFEYLGYLKQQSKTLFLTIKIKYYYIFVLKNKIINFELLFTKK